MNQVHDLSNFDSSCLDLAIMEARQSFEEGNFPVGAVLAIGQSVVGQAHNTAEISGNYSEHAETNLVFGEGGRLLKSTADGDPSTLYTTLEPCLMCLGVATMNKVAKVVYIQADPHAGAHRLDRASLTPRYQRIWPEIVQVAGYSVEPKELILKFLGNQITESKRVEWSKNFMRRFNSA